MEYEEEEPVISIYNLICGMVIGGSIQIEVVLNAATGKTGLRFKTLNLMCWLIYYYLLLKVRDGLYAVKMNWIRVLRFLSQAFEQRR